MDFGALVRPELAGEGGASNLAFNERVKALQAAGHAIAHFAFGQSPFPVPEPFTRHLQDTAGCKDYLPVAGLPELLAGVAAFHREWDGVSLQEDGLVVGPGSKELIYLTLAVYRGTVWLCAPAWTTYSPQARLAGHTPLVLRQPQAQGWKLQAATLEEGLEGRAGPHLLILTNPGNPSGCAYTRAELEALVAVFRRRSVVVLSDEIYARLEYSGNHVCLAELYPEGTILTSGFSKWSSAGGWRLGYAHFPPGLRHLRQAVLGAASHTYSCAPAPLQQAVARALARWPPPATCPGTGPSCGGISWRQGGCWTPWRATARWRRPATSQERLAEVGVSGRRGRAGYYFMPDFEVARAGLAARGVTTWQQMCDLLLKEAGVALMPSSSFLLDKADLTTRFCYVNFEGGPCLEAVYAMADQAAALDHQFVRKFCPELVQGLERLARWVGGLTQQWAQI